jgi:uncharacterized BrkB/YihY/UPF0761 family membrane protein
MKKTVSLILIAALVAASCLVLVVQVKASTATQDSQYSQISEVKSLPSPLIVAALIVALVALFGAILSLYLRWRDNKKVRKQ